MARLMTRNAQGPAVRKLRQTLAKLLGADAQEYAGLVTAGAGGDMFDAVTEAALRRWQSGVGLVADGVAGPHAQGLLGLMQPGPFEVVLELDAVRRFFPATKPANIQRYLPYVAAALDDAGLRDRAMVCAALGTIRAESEGFLPISELPSQLNSVAGQGPFSAYEPGTPKGKRLGNTSLGDGAKFKGRGFVQLTGRENYVRYGQRLGVNLIDQPELANAPEVAAVLLALILADQQVAMRQALAQTPPDYTAARKPVNVKAHANAQGRDRFKAVFEAAALVWPPQAALVAAATTAATAAAARPAHKRSLTVRKDPADLRDRPYLPPPVSLRDAVPSDAEIQQFLPLYSGAKLILNQGAEGACTGFGLACVVNFLRWRKASVPAKFASVSPRMLYHFARRYDEYAGEDYDGSSCRGALRGWFRNGVCLEVDWPYGDGTGDGTGDANLQPRYGYAQRAADHTLGVYYRVALGSITDLQAAIQEVGAVYVSANTHAGWDDVEVPKKPPKGHADIPVIAFDGRPSQIDGHAFALIGFNGEGFIVQNSWGTGWGLGGFAVMSYADWLANAMDAWVVALGVPGVVGGQVGGRARARAAAGAGAGALPGWWSEEQAYRHSVVLGNDGRIKRYLTEDEFSRTLMHQVAVLPDAWFRQQPAAEPKRLLMYAHGGLNSEADAIARARAMGRHFVSNGCYPLFMVWKTGLVESLRHIFEDAWRRDGGRAGAGFGEWITERTDLAVEKTIGRPLARPIWSEMKENAELAFASNRGGDLLLNALRKLIDTWGDQLEIHVIGHSAGSILLGHLLSAMAAKAMPMPRVTSVNLYAPACTVQFANKHYAAQPELMKKLHMDILSDRVERDDNVVSIYRKSLLYLVSNAMEVDLRTPLLGMARVLDPNDAGWDGTSSVSAALRQWREAMQAAGMAKGKRIRLLDEDKVVTAAALNGVPAKLISAAHGSFDNDIAVLSATLERILGGALRQPVDDLRGF